jgi:O-antigen/teichoic acid export membrane protein
MAFDDASMKLSNMSLLKSAGAMFALLAVQRGIGLITIFFLARILDPPSLGAYSFTQTTVQTFYGLVRLGADAGLHVSVAKLQFADDKPQAEVLLGEAMTVFLLIAVVSPALLALLAQPITQTLFGAPELAPLATAIGAMLAAQVMSQYCYSVFAGINAFVAYAHLTCVTSLLTLSLTLIGAIFLGATGGIWGAAAGSAATALALVAWLHRGLRRQGVCAWPRAPSRRALSILVLGLPFYVSGLLVVPAEFLCIGYLSKLEGIAALGELRVVQTLMTGAALLPTALSGPLLSRLASSLDGSGNPTPVLMQIKATWMLSLLITLGFGTSWPVLHDIILGESFMEAKHAGVLALVALTPMTLQTVLTGAFLAARRSGVLVAVGASQMFAIAGSAHVLIGFFGLAGYLSVLAVSVTVGAVTSALLLDRQFGGTFFRPWMLPLTILTIATAALLIWDLLLAESLFVRFLIGGGMLALAALVCARWVLTHDERARLRSAATAALYELRALARAIASGLGPG